MLFNSLTFLVFFLIFYLLYRVKDSNSYRIYLITISSYIFYGFWNSPFVLLLLFSTIVDYNVGKFMFRAESTSRRKLLLVISLFTNLGILFIFKYFNLFLQSGSGLLNLFGADFSPPLINVILPVGISFYTFQTLSYTIDIYYKKIQPERSVWKFAAFVSFFPQLVAGPILRAKEFLPQFKKNRVFSWEIFYQALFLIVFGLFKKMVIADNLAPYVDRVYDSSLIASISDAWFGTYAFALQIYMDFSGYSDIAIGLALLLGFYIPDNFNSPYAAVSFSDFWRRWHISLSSWLRDYLYIPLGGNRRGASRTNINLMLTMLLGGLWHGASWSFVVWGGLHGLYLMLERLLKLNTVRSNRSLAIFARRLTIFHLVLITWVFFRADFDRAGDIISSMVGFIGESPVSLLSLRNCLIIGGITLTVIIFQAYFANRKILKAFNNLKNKTIVYTFVVSLLIFAIITLKGDGGAFIYFQF